MLIDWFTVIAQIVNFLILIALLKYFLYDRIIRAMEQREERIRSRLEDADKKKEEAQSEADEYRRKQEEIESRKEDVLSRAREEADQKREELTREARQEAENLRSKWMEAVEREKSSFLKDLRRLSSKGVYDVSRKVLKDLAEGSLEEQIIEVFLRRLQGMEEDELQKMTENLHKGNNTVQVRSAFEVSTQLRRKITTQLHQTLGQESEVEYETDGDMILGIEMKIHSRKLAWSLGEYLDELERKARDLLERETQEREENKEKEGRGKDTDGEE